MYKRSHDERQFKARRSKHIGVHDVTGFNGCASQLWGKSKLAGFYVLQCVTTPSLICSHITFWSVNRLIWRCYSLNTKTCSTHWLRGYTSYLMIPSTDSYHVNVIFQSIHCYCVYLQPIEQPVRTKYLSSRIVPTPPSTSAVKENGEHFSNVPATQIDFNAPKNIDCPWWTTVDYLINFVTWLPAKEKAENPTILKPFPYRLETDFPEQLVRYDVEQFSRPLLGLTHPVKLFRDGRCNAASFAYAHKFGMADCGTQGNAEWGGGNHGGGQGSWPELITRIYRNVEGGGGGKEIEMICQGQLHEQDRKKYDNSSQMNGRYAQQLFLSQAYGICSDLEPVWRDVTLELSALLHSRYTVTPIEIWNLGCLHMFRG